MNITHRVKVVKGLKHKRRNTTDFLKFFWAKQKDWFDGLYFKKKIIINKA